MISRTARKALARLALAAILFAQAALVFAACELASRAPALAIASAVERIEGATCHEQEMNLNLCLAHCLGDDQSLDKPLVKVPALSAVPVLIVAQMPVSLHRARVHRSRAVPHAAGPPPRILFQSLLI